MKRLAMTAAVVCALAVACGPMWAQETGADRPKREPKRKVRPEKKKQLLRGMHLQMAKVCGLDEQQQKAIAELAAKRGEDLKPVTKQQKPLDAELKAARKAEDQEAVKRIRGELAKVRTQRNRIVAESRQAILAVLTPEQKAKWDQYQFVLACKRRFSGAKLADEQVEKVKAAYVKQAAGVDMSDPKAKRVATAKLYAMIEKDILTPEQRTQSAIAKVTRPYNRLKLTDEQKAQIKTAYLKHTAGVDMTDRKAVWAATSKVQEEIRTDILDEQQRARLKPARKPRDRKPDKAVKAAVVG